MPSVVPLPVRRHSLVSTVREAYGCNKVVVGVSGGADSVALLLLSLAAEAQKSSSCTIVAGHIHHGLREESDNEQRMVEELCDELGVQLLTERVNVSRVQGSLAAGARDARYEALGRMATAVDATYVSVAHHADDQLETMLMALCRGGGIRKLAGMAESRQLTEQIALVRPLLQTDKKDLIHVCTLAGAKWCEDPTNRNVLTPRGRLRKDVIPVLRELWSSSDKHAAQASRILHAAADAYEALAPTGNAWKRKKLAELPTPIIAESIHLAVGNTAKNEMVHAIATAVQDAIVEPRTFECSDGCRVHISAHTVEVCYI